MSNRPLELVRELGPWAAMAIVVGNIIGTGVFLVPHEMALHTGAVGLVFAVWVVGGVLSLFGALTVAEMGGAIPEAGGGYVYLSRGFGPAWGFLYGWMNAVVGKPTSIATIAAGFAIFFGFFVPEVSQPLFTLAIPLPFQEKPYEFVFKLAQPVAVAAILFITFVNYLGVRLAGQFQVVLTTLKVGSILAVVLFGFAMSEGSGTNFQPLLPKALGPGVVGGFLTALAAALWAYDGWIELTLAGSEVRNPQRNIPLALIGGTIAVGAVYLLANAVYFYVLPFETVLATQNVASAAVEGFAGHGAAQWITVAMMISALGALNSSVLTGARVPYAMARDGVFFRGTQGIHPAYRTPAGALVFQGVLASVMSLTGQFNELFSLFIFAQWIFYGLTVASVFWLRRKEPNLERPYRAWGYPWVPAVFVVGALALTVNLYRERPIRSTIGLGLILLGLVFYRRWKQKASEDGNPTALRRGR